jgi:hypothetical protein
VVLDDGEAFAGFVETIKPEDVDNHAIMDDVDPRWWLRNGLTTVVEDVFGQAKAEVCAREKGEGDLSHSTQELLTHGERIGKALDDSGWGDRAAEKRTAREISELPRYADAGIVTSYLDLSGSGVLDDDLDHGPSGWVHDGPIDGHVIGAWADFARVAQSASEARPDLAGNWPHKVQQHYEATVEYLQDRGRIAELMEIEGAVGHEVRALPER